MTPLRLLLLVCLLLAGGASAAPGSKRILIFSGSTGYRHESIPAGVAAIAALARRQGMAATATEDPASLDDLSGYAAIVLLSTSTDPKDPASEWWTGARREALRRFVRGGGGIVAIHAAADSHYHWPWYGRLIGGRFERHPPGTPRGTLHRAARRHPAARGLPARFEKVDEFYYFTDFDPGSDILLTLDPASIGEDDVNPNPISWTRRVEGGRVFYTALGHTPETFSETLFLRHLAGGLGWAASGD